MKSFLTIWLIALLCPVITAIAQKPMNQGRLMQAYSKTNRISDPEKAISEYEKYIESLAGSNNKKMVRGRYMMSFRLSDLYVRTGQYQKSENVLTSLLDEVRKQRPKPGKSSLGIAGTMYDAYEKLGYFYLKTGNLKKAEQIFNESKQVRNKIFPKNSVHRVQPIVALGSLQFAKGELEKTYASFNEAEKMLARATTSMYNYDNIIRLYLNDLVEICFLQNKNEEAWTYINKLSIASTGIATFGSKLGKNMELSRLFELKARYYLLENNYRKAQEYLDEAIKYYPVKVASSDIKLKLLKTQALLYWYQGKTMESNETFIKLIESYRAHINNNFISMSEYEKEQFYNTLKSDLDLFNAYTIETNLNNSQLYDEIYNTTLNTKALLLNETNKIKNAILGSHDAALISNFNKWENLKAELSSAFFDKEGTNRIDSLESAIESLENTINQQTQLFANKAPVQWAQISQHLKADEVAIEVVRISTIDHHQKNNYGRHSGLSDSIVYLVLIIRNNSTTPQHLVIANGNELEGRLISFYRNAIESRIEDQLTYEKFWRPIKMELSGISKIYFSPDGVYNQINLNTLYNSSSNKYLIDEVELVYLTNSADLLKTNKPPSLTSPGILFGRPDYDFLQSVTPSTVADSKPYGKRTILTDNLVELKNKDFEDLPGTETEISTIEKALVSRKIEVRAYKGTDAREEIVKSVSNPSILHIATHGFFVDDAASQINPMIRSGLVLAGVKNRGDESGDDGILTAYEATNLNLEQTSLVALSACETGLGEIRNGEGVYGLQRAIIVAGAHNLLMSLWKVDDAATASLMSDFYENWNFDDNQTVFRKAQMELRKKYPEPYYWGAFIMLGK